MDETQKTDEKETAVLSTEELVEAAVQRERDRVAIGKHESDAKKDRWLAVGFIVLASLSAAGTTALLATRGFDAKPSELINSAAAMLNFRLGSSGLNSSADNIREAAVLQERLDRHETENIATTSTPESTDTSD